MKLKFAFFVLTALCTATGCVKDYPENAIEPDVLPLSDAEPHYWAGNTKVAMKAQPEKSFIIFNGEDRYDIIDAEKMDYHVFKTAKVPEGRMFSKGLTRAADIENATWAIGSTRAFEMSEDKILYKSQAYTNSKGVDVFVSHLFYVKLKSAEDYPVLQRMADENGVEIIGEVGARLDLWYKLACSAQSDCDAVAMSARFYESGLFQYAEPDIMFEVRSCSKQPNSYPEYQAPTRAADAPVPNDPLFPQQWYLHNPGGLDINYLEAKAITQGSSDITVLVIDIYGVAHNHPDLPDNFNEYYNDLNDIRHGTACVGIMGAKTNNNIGIAGIAPNCTYKFKQLPMLYGIDQYATICNTLYNGALNNNADVISCSWEAYPEENVEGMMMVSELFYQLHQCGRWHYDETKNLGCVVIFASGNCKLNEPSYIAGWADLSVSAILKNGDIHSTSNYGSVAAPGQDIITTYPMEDRYFTLPDETTEYWSKFEQTSAACPQAAATAALILSLNPNLYHYEVVDYIKSTAQPLSNPKTGNGLLNVGAALQAVIDDIQ